MKTNKTIPTLLTALCCCGTALTYTSCVKDGDDTIAIERYSLIPTDDEADEAPSIINPNASIPNITTSEDEYENEKVIRFDMTGIWDSNAKEWMYLKGTGLDGQNIWLTIDGKPKGFLIYNTSDGTSGEKVSKADLVFTVDNSGSMSQEAEAIASGIMSWANELSSSGLDVSFGCVGYAETGYINGAIDMTTSTELSNFLNYSSGTSRTMHFGGSNYSTLKSKAGSFGKVGHECGAMAIRFADTYFNFRSGANRIYVNFTDEPNQPNNTTKFSTEYFKTNWTSAQGTVHTVFSEDTTWTEKMYYEEKPWRISWYTGGTTLVASSTFSGVTLSSLPVSGAMINSYIIRFLYSDDLKDGKYHKVVITIRSTDGTVRAVKTFSIKF